MNISGLALKLLIYMVLDEHEITREKLLRKFSESSYDVNKALDELLDEKLVTPQKVYDDLSHYWIFGVTITGRSYLRHLGEQLRDIYVP